MLLSVLIPVYQHHPATLLEALANEIEALGAREVEVLVVDDSADPRLFFWHALYQTTRFDWLQVFAHPHNLGRSKARNFLMSQAKGQFICFLDGDVELPAGLLSAYVDALRKDPAVYCSGISCPPDAPANLRNWYTQQVEVKTAQVRNQAPYRSFSAANFAMPRTFANTVQFPENHQGYGHEDTHFGLQLLQAGLAVRHFDLPVIHASDEADAVYLQKIKESVQNLVRLYRTEPLFQLYAHEIRLIGMWRSLSSFGLAYAVGLCTPWLEKGLLRGRPSLLFLQLYKLGCFERFYRASVR